VFGAGDEPLGSVGLTEPHATQAARAGRTLLDDAGEDVTQVHASLAEGDVFVVRRQDGPAIVAVTAARQPAGLLFHDLKRCLRSIVEGQE